MRTIIVGFGRIADTIRLDEKIAGKFKYASHSQVLSEHPSFEWLGVVDPSPEARDRAVKSWGVVADSHLEESVKAYDPECAIICTPPGTRLEIIRQIPNLKAVMLEKPLGEEAEALVAYCATRNIDITVNYWRRGVHYFQVLAERLKYEVGDIQAVNCIYGNGLLNNGSHLIDFLRMLLGEPEDVAALSEVETLDAIGCSGPVDDYSAAFDLDYGGFHCTVHPVDFNHYREVSVEIWGALGRLWIAHESCSVFLSKRQKHRSMSNQREVPYDSWLKYEPDFSHALWGLYDGMAARKSISTGRSALKTQQILDDIIALRRSSENPGRANRAVL